MTREEKREFVMEIQDFYNDNYRRKRKALEEEYRDQMRMVNNQFVSMAKEKAQERGKDLLIVRVSFYTPKGQACDIDALWISDEAANVGDRVNVYTDMFKDHCLIHGYIKTRYDVSVNSNSKFTTLACPFNNSDLWCVR